MTATRPMMRKEKKALRYLDALSQRVLARPELGFRSESAARAFAEALVLASLFNPEERALFADLYERREALTDDEREAEVRALCARQGEVHLCQVITWIFKERRDQPFVNYVMRAIEDDLWQQIAEELREERLQPEHFAWELR